MRECPFVILRKIACTSKKNLPEFTKFYFVNFGKIT